MLPWTLIWQNVWVRRGRTLLTVLSIAIGVAAVVSVLQAAVATHEQFAQLERAVAAKAGLEVVAAEGAWFPDADLPDFSTIEGVRAAVPILRGFSTLSVDGARARVMVVGMRPEQYQLVQDFTIRQGRAFRRQDEILVNADLAQNLSITPGQTVEILTPSRLRPYERTVTGVAAVAGITKLQESSSIYLPLEEMERLWRARGKLSVVQILTDEGVAPARVAAAVSAVLPPSLVVREISSPAKAGQELRTLVNTGLETAATLSVVAAVFVVLNTFLMSVTERQRQLAVMRLVGATSAQIRNMLLQEAVILSLLGTLLGVALGAGGGFFLTRIMEAIYNVRIQAPLQPWVIAAGLAFGPLVTLLAAAYPARLARTIPPLEIIRGIVVGPRRRMDRRLPAFGLAVLLVALTITYFSTRGEVSIGVSIAALNLGLLAFVLLIPSLLPSAARLIQSVSGRVMRVEAVLARHQVLNYGARSALTIGVLFIVTATAIGVGNTNLDVTDDVESWFDTAFAADFVIRVKMPRSELPSSETVPKEAEQQIARLPSIERVDRLTYLAARLNDEPTTLLVRQFANHPGLPLDLRVGRPAEVRQRLLAGEVVLGTVAAHRAGLQVGDTTSLHLLNFTHSVRIAGLTNDYTSGGNIVLMDRAAAQRLVPLNVQHVYLINAAPGRVDQVRASLETVAREHGLLFHSFADFRRVIRESIAGVTTGLWLLLVLGLVIAAFGIVNTLSMNVLEQTRTLGLLRVVGMTRRQVRRLILCQALIMAVPALVPGVLVGMLIAFLISLTFYGLFGRPIEFHPHVGLVGGTFAAATALVLLAAAIPARRASQLAPLEAIREE